MQSVCVKTMEVCHTGSCRVGTADFFNGKIHIDVKNRLAEVASI